MGGCAVKISNEEFAVIGGVNQDGHPIARMVKYNTKTKTWSEWGNLVQARYEHKCTIVEGKVIVTGGNDMEGNNGMGGLRSTEVISVETGMSRRVGDMHEGRVHFALVTFGEQSQRVMAIGGLGDHVLHSSVEIFDLHYETWSLAQIKLEEPLAAMGYLPITADVCK